LNGLVVCCLLVLVRPSFAFVQEIPNRYSGYHTQDKSLTDTEFNQGTAIISTITFSNERNIIPEVTDSVLRALAQNHIASPEFVSKVPMPPYGKWMGKKWDPANAFEFHLYQLFSVPKGRLYALDFRSYPDNEKSHELGVVAIVEIEDKILLPKFSVGWGHWHSGEYTDKCFYGLVGEEIVLRERFITGTLYGFYKFNGKEIEKVRWFYDKETNESQYFNPD